jgi:hypothetical protein
MISDCAGQRRDSRVVQAVRAEPRWKASRAVCQALREDRAAVVGQAEGDSAAVAAGSVADVAASEGRGGVQEQTATVD